MALMAIVAALAVLAVAGVLVFGHAHQDRARSSLAPLPLVNCGLQTLFRRGPLADLHRRCGDLAFSQCAGESGRTDPGG